MVKKSFAWMLVLCALLSVASLGLAEAGAGPAPLAAGMFEGPIVLTSVGQSADVNIVNTLFTKAGIEVRMVPTLAADDLGDAKTLVLAIGGSSKGLGAAGIDEHQELARVQAVIAAAKEKEMKILALHIGGAARRGVLSDMFIPDSINAADAVIVKEDGDTDNLMRDLLAKGEIPAQYVKSQIEVLEPLTLVFTQAE